jgi:hypothetical protein
MLLLEEICVSNSAYQRDEMIQEAIQESKASAFTRSLEFLDSKSFHAVCTHMDYSQCKLRLHKALGLFTLVQLRERSRMRVTVAARAS